MRITLYRADIEAAVRAYICSRLLWAEKSVVVTSGDGVIQVDLGDAPFDQTLPGTVQQAVKPADYTSYRKEGGLAGLVSTDVTASMSTLHPTGGLSGVGGIFAKKVTPAAVPTPEPAAAVEVVVEATPSDDVVLTVLNEMAAEPPVDEKPEDTNDNVVPLPAPVEPVADPVRKVQSLFKNLKKPVNG